METRVVVFGSSRCPEGSAHHRQAQAVGRALARRGLTLVSGGYAGSMGAASRGAREAGGRVVGITTSIFADRAPNAWLDHFEEEPDYPARMARLLREGEAWVALPGGLGTLAEWTTAWCLATIGQLPGPLWAFTDPWRPVQEAILRLAEVRAQDAGLVRWVDDSAALERELDRWLDGS
jgi:uncharacterized protein (TIGR00730 family)